MAGSHALPAFPHRLDDLEPELFRLLGTALDHPGVGFRVPHFCDAPPPLYPATAAVAATLISAETPVWTDLAWNCRAADWLQATTGGALVTEPAMASIALVADPLRLPHLDRFRCGDPERPESSVLLVVQVKNLAGRLAGGSARGNVGPNNGIGPGRLPARFWKDWAAQRRLDPAGVDVILTWRNVLAALSRELEAA